MVAMKLCLKLPACLLLFSAPLLAMEGHGPLFPASDDLEPALKMPVGAAFEIGPDGNFLVGGKPRFLLGTIYYLASSDSDQLRPGPGYPPEHAWLYETPPTRDYLQRVGFDSAGGEVPTTWMHKYLNDHNFGRANRLVDWSVTTNLWQSGLPAILDLTAAVWSHGGLPNDKRCTLPERAFVDDERTASHFVSYSLLTEEEIGRAHV